MKPEETSCHGRERRLTPSKTDGEERRGNFEGGTPQRTGEPPSGEAAPNASPRRAGPLAEALQPGSRCRTDEVCLWEGGRFPEEAQTRGSAADVAMPAACAVDRVVKERIVKRYPNRKLYDTQESRYVTLDEVARLVRAGQNVCIVDHHSKQDLTSVTLAQIVYEEEKRKGGRRSVDALRELVEHGGERLLSSLRRPVDRLMQREQMRRETNGGRETKEVRRSGALEQIDIPGGDYDDLPEDSGSAGAPKRSAVKVPREMLEELHRRADEPMRALVARVTSHVQQLQSEVRRLQARIEALESAITLRKTRAPKE